MQRKIFTYIANPSSKFRVRTPLSFEEDTRALNSQLCSKSRSGSEHTGQSIRKMRHRPCVLNIVHIIRTSRQSLHPHGNIVQHEGNNDIIGTALVQIKQSHWLALVLIFFIFLSSYQPLPVESFRARQIAGGTPCADSGRAPSGRRGPRSGGARLRGSFPVESSAP